ncbi:F0F1 ATP synthase subunit delta [Microbulbifer yueqingensis]|uniref:ATP synthase subunit b n=1 Tax=Microbulbifer yueqingensis TaxID=658219 RepID=A0A1G8ZU89_9GAMM|nr:F0F1 ATP synthase subunit delta [Microbulbifer yueqingensis]SDK18699.1 ATP synthase F0 subcomplex B subunit [Microbulbifer yueqingensis]
MELNWSTFLLEIINFLILVWLLKRFFYRPVQDVIARRQQRIDQRVAEADKIRADAEQMQQQLSTRLDDWGAEQQQAREQLHRDLKAERAKLERKLEHELQEQRQRAGVLAGRQLREQQLELERQAAEQGVRFAARLLEQAAGPELEKRLQAILVDTLGDLSGAQQEALRAELGRQGVRVEVTSAYPVAAGERAEIREALESLAGSTVEANFVEDPELIAGIQLNIGAWALDCNIREELRGFARIGRADVAGGENPW